MSCKVVTFLISLHAILFLSLHRKYQLRGIDQLNFLALKINFLKSRLP